MTSAIAAGMLVSQFAPSQTRVAPEQIRLPRIARLESCAIPMSCAGFYHVQIVTPAGTTLDLVGEPTTLITDPTFPAPAWQPVP